MCSSDLGAGTGAHLAAEMFRYLANVNLTHVPYKGSAQALTDVMSGRVQLMFSPVVATVQHVQSGRLRALGVTSATRSRVMPDVPTIAEAGVNGYAFGAWYGIVAPAGPPAAITQRLNTEATRATQAPEVKERLNAEDMDAATTEGHAVKVYQHTTSAVGGFPAHRLSGFGFDGFVTGAP